MDGTTPAMCQKKHYVATIYKLFQDLIDNSRLKDPHTKSNFSDIMLPERQPLPKKIHNCILTEKLKLVEDIWGELDSTACVLSSEFLNLSLMSGFYSLS